MLTIALGNDKYWERYSKPKPLDTFTVSVVEKGGKIVTRFKHGPTWRVRHNCKLSHAYIMNSSKEVLVKIPLQGISDVRRGDTVDLDSFEIEHTFIDSDEPYLV